MQSMPVNVQAQIQPPSGGCVLKPEVAERLGISERPAAFRRLCVETVSAVNSMPSNCASRLQAAVC